MATTTIPWGDGSGDNIYLTYPSASGNQTVDVTSDANTGAARSKVVTFSTGSITQQLTVNQVAGGPPAYIESRGGAYVDTLLQASTEYSISCRFQLVNPGSTNICPLGFWANPYACRLYWRGGNRRFYYQYKNTTATATTSTDSDSWHDLTIGGGVLTLDGVSYNANGNSGTPSVNIMAFASATTNNPYVEMKSTNSIYIRIASLSISLNNTLLRDYVPQDVGGVGYLYDKVSETSFGNAGNSGTLVPVY